MFCRITRIIQSQVEDNTGEKTLIFPHFGVFFRLERQFQKANKKHTSNCIKVCFVSGNNPNYCLFYNNLRLTYLTFFGII